MKLSQVVDLAARIARTNRNYPLAAVQALEQSGYKDSKRFVYSAVIQNDIGANESDTLLHAVTSELGKRAHRPRPTQVGTQTLKVIVAKKETQTVFSF